MNDQTKELLDRLSEQLGTTTEYLWEALLIQAPISSTTQTLALGVAGFGYYKLVKALWKKPKPDMSWSEKEDHGGVRVALLMAGAVYSLVVLFVLSDIMAGFLNPRYWALQRLLAMALGD